MISEIKRQNGEHFTIKEMEKLKRHGNTPETAFRPYSKGRRHYL